MFVKRIHEKKHQAILEKARTENKNNNIILETYEQWNQRNKKNQNKFSFIAIETIEESNNILNHQVFLNALNNAIRADNKEIKTPIFVCEMNNNANNKKYENLPDNLKKLLFISTKKLAEFISIFEKNDNEKYFLHQEKLKSQIEGKKPGNNSLR